MKKFLIIVMLCFALFGCSENSSEVQKEEYQILMEQNDYIIIDVRTKEEFEMGQVKGAINIPYDEINEDTLIDKDKLIFVYCVSGVRSNAAYNTLISLGYNAYDLGAYDLLKLEKE